MSTEAQRAVIATNPLIAVLVKAGFRLRFPSALVGAYYMSNDNDDLLLIHPMCPGMAIDAFPVEVIS